jgi:hypothetical protein
LGAVEGSHSAVFNNAIDSRLNFSATCARASDLALSEWAAISSCQELHATIGVSLNPSQVFALAANNQADQAGLDLDSLRVVIASS